MWLDQVKVILILGRDVLGKALCNQVLITACLQRPKSIERLREVKTVRRGFTCGYLALSPRPLSPAWLLNTAAVKHKAIAVANSLS
jgi:hypothetical protein